MADELLVADQLTDDMVASGAALVNALDRLKVLVKAAFWLLVPNERTWRLVVVSPEVRVVGPKTLYRRIAAANKRLPAEVKAVSTRDVTVVDDSAPVYSLLRIAIGTGARGVNGIRFTQNVINGQKIEDAFVYRMT